MTRDLAPAEAGEELPPEGGTLTAEDNMTRGTNFHRKTNHPLKGKE